MVSRTQQKAARDRFDALNNRGAYPMSMYGGRKAWLKSTGRLLETGNVDGRIAVLLDTRKLAIHLHRTLPQNIDRRDRFRIAIRGVNCAILQKIT
jgi:hypothetical protein